MKTENSIAFEKLVSARPVLIGCRRAGEVIPGFRRNLILHSGPELEFVTRFAEFQPELDYIQNHCTAATTVEELAALRKTRRETFTRKFTAATGITPKELLTQAVLNRAGNLLLRGNYRVREVAFELGFSNEFYFSRFFRRHLGCSPREYRKLYRVLAGDPAGAAERRAGEGGKSVLTSPGGTDLAPAASRRTAP